VGSLFPVSLLLIGSSRSIAGLTIDEEVFEADFVVGDRDLDLEDDEDLLDAPDDDLEDFLLFGGGDIDDLRGPLANSASAALSPLSELLPVLLPEVDRFLSSGSFLIFLIIPVDDEARFINLFCRGAVFLLTGLSDRSGLFLLGIPSGVEDLDLERDLEDLDEPDEDRPRRLFRFGLRLFDRLVFEDFEEDLEEPEE